MSSPLEKFILENREKFDAEPPDPRVWEKINENLNPQSEKTAPVRSMPFKRWLAAASVIVLAGLSIVLYYSVHQNKNTEVAGRNQSRIDSNNHLPAAGIPADTSAKLARKER